MSANERVSLTASTLKGIAHPLRVRLLGLLRSDGPSTATRLAQRVGQSSGVTSYHLRQLALHGFVEEDPERGSGRERWWRAAHRVTELRAESARQAPGDAEAYLRAIATTYADRVSAWLDGMAGLPREWDEGATLSDWSLRLTAAESAGFIRELEALVDRYRADRPDAAAPAGAERVIAQIQVLPFVAGTAGDEVSS
ncbi:winged helix-turn-helix domain-containing protein [Luedemannella helvata]|uniref:HTH arsR-type domain-containing protein n=1 Tax=Luedemannella helvata TaxID=349315 RepID=A0ABP4WDF7_9ACTN